MKMFNESCCREVLQIFTWALVGLLFVAPDSNASPVSQEGTVLEMVVASVDGDPITSADLKKFMARQGTPDLDVNSGDQRVRKLLRDLIVERLIAKEAEGLNISISDEEVSQYIREVQAQNRVDESGFEAILKGQGLSLEEYRKEVKQEIVRARVVASRVRSKINVVDEDIDRFLKEHPDRVPGGNKVRVEQVSFRLADDATTGLEALRAQANSARERASEGESLAKVGGESYVDLGFVSIDELKPELQAAAAGLEVGKVSEVIPDGSGFYILRVAEKSEEGVASSGIRDEIRKELFDQYLTTALEKFLNDELPSKYSVEMKL